MFHLLPDLINKVLFISAVYYSFTSNNKFKQEFYRDLGQFEEDKNHELKKKTFCLQNCLQIYKLTNTFVKAV